MIYCSYDCFGVWLAALWLFAGPRIPYAMALDGLFFGFAKRIQPVFHTPSGAVIFQGCVAIMLVLTGTHQELYSYTSFVTVVDIVLSEY